MKNNKKVIEEYSADIRENGSEILHYDNPDFQLFGRYNNILSTDILNGTAMHWHEDIEFIYVVNGSIIQHINGEKIILHKGEGIFINSGQIHVVENNNDNCDLYCLIFKPYIMCSSKYVNDMYVSPITSSDRYPYRFLKEDNPVHKEMLEKIKRVVENYFIVGNEMIVLSVLYELWMQLYKELGVKPDDERIQDSDLNIISKMILFIHAQYREEINLQDICKSGGAGKTKCSELFDKYIHLSPIEYLICYRLEKASELLKNTNMSVTDIAFETGFSGASYFTATFKKRVGCTPLAYRKEFCGNEKMD